MNIDVPSASQDLTANGGADGYVTVTDNSKYYTGCIAFLTNDNTSQRVIITEIAASNKVGVRFIADDLKNQTPQYGGRSNASAYTTALHSRLNMSAQLAKIEAANTRTLTTV